MPSITDRHALRSPRLYVANAASQRRSSGAVAVLDEGGIQELELAIGILGNGVDREGTERFAAVADSID